MFYSFLCTVCTDFFNKMYGFFQISCGHPAIDQDVTGLIFFNFCELSSCNWINLDLDMWSWSCAERNLWWNSTNDDKLSLNLKPDILWDRSVYLLSYMMSCWGSLNLGRSGFYIRPLWKLFLKKLDTKFLFLSKFLLVQVS